MVQFAEPNILLRVSEASKNLRNNWMEGVSLEARSRHTLNELRDRTIADRLTLAQDARRRARLLSRMTPPMYRDAISRYYYCLYHGFRAVAYFAHGGDDFEEHSKLPTGIPNDFPDADSWRTKLKDARLTRNRADYNAYPKAEKAWKLDCDRIASIAEGAMSVCQSYLTGRGCRYL